MGVTRGSGEVGAPPRDDTHAVVVCSAISGEILRANEAFTRLIGIAESRLVGERLDSIDDAEEVFGVLARVIAQAREPEGAGEVHDEAAVVLPDGRTVQLKVQAVRLEVNDDPVVAVVCDARRPSTAASPGDAEVHERLAALGTTASSFAHDLSSPLAYVHTNVELLQELLDDLLPERGASREREQARECVEDALTGLNRCIETVTGLKRYLRGEEEGASLVDPNDAVRAAGRLAAASLPADLRIDYDLGDVPRVRGRDSLLIPAVIDLLTHAAAAVERTGTAIRVATRYADDRVHIDVTDDGPGISAHLQARMFEPMFTTRGERGGAGLGLSSAQRNVQALGGTLGVRSTPGEGATFTIELPPSATAGAAPAVAVDPDRARVLIVDDDAIFRRALKRALSKGYIVDQAEDGLAALAKMREQEFDVVLCDVRMRPVDGLEMLRRLGAEDPSLLRRVVLMTGGDLRDASELTEELKSSVLAKPLDLAHTRATIDRVAQRRAAAR